LQAVAQQAMWSQLLPLLVNGQRNIQIPKSHLLARAKALKHG
jgi:hypothetical protein